MPNKATIAVCIDAHPKTNVLLRAAANKAKENNQPWAVIYVETPDHYAGDRESRERILRFLTIAEEMGAQVTHVEHNDVLGGIVSYVRNAGVRQLIMGQSSKEGFLGELRATLAERVTRELRKYKVSVQIIPLTHRQYTSSWFDRFQLRDIKAKEILFALASVFLAYGAAEILRASVANIEWQVQVHNVMAFFLIATVVSALRYGLISGLVSAIAGFTTINYFYIAPFYTFGILHTAEGVSLSIFLISAVVVSLMGAFSQATNLALARKEKRSQALYKVHRLASEATTRNQAFKILHEELTHLLEMEVAFFLPPAMNPDAIELAYPPNIEFSEKDTQSLNTCWQEVRTTGLGTLNRFDSYWRFEPLSTPNSEIGVMAIKVPKHIYLDPSFGRLLSALADQAASILERIELTKMMSESRMREEREKLRSMLLSSVSHDLKTPLASIIGSMSVYKRMQRVGRLNQETADELVETTLDEAQRLDSFISNILDMTRIESGEISFEEEWVDAESPIKNVKKRLNQRLSKHSLKTQLLTPTSPFVLMDKMMTEQVLQNVVDNAVKYSPKGTEIILKYGAYENGFAYIIQDQGPGIPQEKFEAIFDKYERLKQSDSKVAGTGLGLAIAKAVMEKQNGRIFVRNHEGGGAEFVLWFPHIKKGEKE